MTTIGAGAKNIQSLNTVAGGRPPAASQGAAAKSTAGGGVPTLRQPLAAATVQPPEKPSTPLTPLYKAYRLRNLDVAHKAAIVTSLQQLTFENSAEGKLVKIDICLKKGDPITSLLFEDDDQRRAIRVSLENIREAASAVTPSDLANLAKHFDGMVKSGWDKLLIDCCVKADEEAACAAACVSIEALPAESSGLAGDWGHLTTGKAALSTRLKSAETTTISDHQRITTDTEALRLDIQTLQQSQLMSIRLDTAHNDIRTEVNAYNAEIQAQNTVLAAQKAAIVALGKEIQQKKTASSLNLKKADLDAMHVELEKKAQSLSALKSKLTDAISSLDVRITASNPKHLANVCTEFVEAALSQWALAKLGALGTTLMNKNGEAMVQALLDLQKDIQTTTRQRASDVLSPLYEKFNARPPETDDAIAACLTDISTQLATFDREYKAYSDLLAPYKKEVTEFNKANATALSEVNTLVERQAEAIAKLERSLATASVENASKKSGLTDKITLLNKASQKAGTENSAITAELNSKITQYNANIDTLHQLEAVQKILVDDVASSNVAISAYNQDVADFATKVSVANKDKTHIEQYNISTEVLDRRNKITKQIMANVAAVTDEPKAIPPQSSPSTTGSGGASGSDPYRLMWYDTRVSFPTLDISGVKIPLKIPQLACSSLSSSFATIEVATGGGLELIQVTLSEITVVIPLAEDCVSDITVQDATTIAREFPSIGTLAQPNQQAITVRVPFITKEMLREKLKELNEQLQALEEQLKELKEKPKDSVLKEKPKDSVLKDALALKEKIKDRITKWNELITKVTAVNKSKSTTTQVTCPVTKQAKRAPFLTTVQANGDVWAFTSGPNGESYPTYRWERPMTKGKAEANAATTDKLNTSLQELKQQLGKQPA